MKDNATKGGVDVKIQFAADENGKAATKNSDIKYFKVTCATSDELKKWTNNGLASAEITTEDGATANNVKIIVTKVMPDAATAKALLDGKDWRANQLVDGVFDSYMYPSDNASTLSANWSSDAQAAFKDMSKVYWLKDNATVVIANAQKHDAEDDNKGKYVDDLVAITSPWNVAVDPALVDNETEHESAIKYNFGKIDSANPDEELLVTIENYKTIFSCPLVESAQTLGWKQWESADKKTKADVNYLYYGETEPKDANDEAIDLLKYITVVNKYDSKEFGSTMKELLTHAKSAKVEVRSNSVKGNADYFTGSISLTSDNDPTLTMTPTTTGAPTSDVESYFVVIVKDAFGHTHEYAVPFTVKVKKN